MKKLALCLMTLVLCVCTLIAPVHATETFVPSISAKPAPEFVVVETLEDGTVVLGYIVDAEGNELECVEPTCIILTSLEDALKEGSEVPQEIIDELTSFYNAIKDGTVKLSSSEALNALVAEKFGDHNNADNLTIKELFHVDFHHLECEQALEEQEGSKVTLTLDVDIEKDAFFTVIRYKDGQIEVLEDCVNNNDGTITITSESFCPVAVLVEGAMAAAPTPAPEQASFNWLYVIIPVVIACAGYVLSKKTKKA